MRVGATWIEPSDYQDFMVELLHTCLLYTAKGKVILNKTDKSSGEPLKGVEFELRDSKGKVLETLKTDACLLYTS